MTDNSTAPQEWAIKAAVQRCASAAVGHSVALDDVTWRLGTSQADHTDPDGAVVPAGTRTVLFGVRGSESVYTIALVGLAGIALAIAQDAQ